MSTCHIEAASLWTLLSALREMFSELFSSLLRNVFLAKKKISQQLCFCEASENLIALSKMAYQTRALFRSLKLYSTSAITKQRFSTLLGFSTNITSFAIKIQAVL